LLLDAIVLSDLQIICISSVCCDLRFYEVSSHGKCSLLLYIRDFPSPINTFHYHSSTNSQKLVFGDRVGCVRVIDFMKNFKSQLRIGSVIRQISYTTLIKVCTNHTKEEFLIFFLIHPLLKGRFETMKCKEFLKLHSDIVRQVSFVESLNSFISASENVITKNVNLPSVIIANIDYRDSQTVFKMNKVGKILQFTSNFIILFFI
jgi:hypothetical protein